MAAAKEARRAELAIIISYPTSASGVIVLLKTATKYREFFPTLFLKTTDFQLVFNFSAAAYSYYIWRAWYNQQLFLAFEWAIDSEAMRARGIIVLVKSN